MSDVDDFEVMIDNGVRALDPSGKNWGKAGVPEYQSFLLRCNTFHHEVNRLNAQLPLPGDPYSGIPNTLIVDWLQVSEAIIVTGVVYYTSPNPGVEPSVNDLEDAVRLWWKNFVTGGMVAANLCTLTEKRASGSGYIAYRGLFDSLKLERESGVDDWCKFTLTFLSAFKEDLGNFMPPFSGMLMFYEDEVNYKGNAAHDLTVFTTTNPHPDLPGKWIWEVNKQQIRLVDTLAGRVRSAEIIVGNPHEVISTNYSDTFPQRVCLVDPRSGKVMFLGRLDNHETYPAGDGGQYIKLTVYDLMKVLQDACCSHDYRFDNLNWTSEPFSSTPGTLSPVDFKATRSELIRYMIFGSDWPGYIFPGGAQAVAYKAKLIMPADRFNDLALVINPSPQTFTKDGDGKYGRNYSGSTDSVLSTISALAAEDPWSLMYNAVLNWDEFKIFDFYCSWPGTPKSTGLWGVGPFAIGGFKSNWEMLDAYISLWLDLGKPSPPADWMATTGWAIEGVEKDKSIWLNYCNWVTNQTSLNVGAGYDFYVEDGIAPDAYSNPGAADLGGWSHPQATFRYFKRGSLDVDVTFMPDQSSDYTAHPLIIQYDPLTAVFGKYQGERLTKVTVRTDTPANDVTDGATTDAGGVDEATEESIEQSLMCVREKTIYDPSITSKNDALLRRSAELKASETLWTASFDVPGYPLCWFPRVDSNGNYMNPDLRPLRAGHKVKVYFPNSNMKGTSINYDFSQWTTDTTYAEGNTVVDADSTGTLIPYVYIYPVPSKSTAANEPGKENGQFWAVFQSGAQLTNSGFDAGDVNKVTYNGIGGTPDQVFDSIRNSLYVDPANNKPITIWRASDSTWYAWLPGFSPAALAPYPIPDQIMAGDVCYIWVSGKIYWSWRSGTSGFIDAIVVGIEYNEPPAMSTITVMELLETGGGYSFARSLQTKLNTLDKTQTQTQFAVIKGRK